MRMLLAVALRFACPESKDDWRIGNWAGGIKRPVLLPELVQPNVGFKVQGSETRVSDLLPPKQKTSSIIGHLVTLTDGQKVQSDGKNINLTQYIKREGHPSCSNCHHIDCSTE